MSHAKERIEKNCLNCNAIVTGRFCQVCGQENIETHETFGHLAGHFISDIFHFDGMFFSTSKYLLFKPGFLTYEYVRGRRASYLNPIKMYVFISAIFFLLFFSFFKPEINFGKEKKEKTAAEVLEDLKEDQQNLEESLASKNVPEIGKIGIRNSLQLLNTNIAILEKDSTRKEEVLQNVNSTLIIAGDNTKYRTEAQYDSVQKILPKAERDGWLVRKMKIRNIYLGKKYDENKGELLNGLVENFLHHFPQLLFISLPLFALILQLLYVRRKQFYYANHIIYTVHLYCAVFIFILLMLLIGKADDLSYLSWLSWVSYAILLYMTYYTYKTLRVFYGQSRGKTIVKWLLLNTIAFFVITGLFIFLFAFTFFTV